MKKRIKIVKSILIIVFVILICVFGKISLSKSETEYCTTVTYVRLVDTYAAPRRVEQATIYKPKYEHYWIEHPNYSGTKAWMGYQKVTNTSTKQYDLLHNYSYTNEQGFRMCNNRYCVAFGTGINAEVGQYVDILLENGTIIKCIQGDVKADIHTDESCIFTVVNDLYCCSEFIVDERKFKNNFSGVGDVSLTKEEWNAKVIEIKVYEDNIFYK